MACRAVPLALCSIASGVLFATTMALASAAFDQHQRWGDFGGLLHRRKKRSPAHPPAATVSPMQRAIHPSLTTTPESVPAR
ncbi:hypothetical protein GCM10027074_37220 [Streptomyces deserti]